MKPLSFYVGSDVLSFIFAYTPALSAWGTGAWFAYSCVQHGLAPLAVVSPLVAAFGLFLHLFMFRMILPRLKAGVYSTEPSAMMISWWAQVLMARAINIAGLRALVFSTSALRWVYFRAMGAKLSYRTALSLNVDLTDFSLVTIGPDAIIGEGTEISCHTMTQDRLLIAPVVIGPKVLIATKCLIGPRTKIEEGAVVGVGNALYNCTIEAGRKIKDFEFAEGKPRPS